jgi:hypothetical protein
MRSLVSSLVVLIALGITLGVSLASATQNPTPFVNQPLIPASIAPGGAGFTLTVNGTGFVSGSVVNWNGSPRATTFVTGSQVTASILASDIVAATTGSVTVVSPTPGGGTSNVVFLPVREAAGFVSLNATSFGVQLPPSTFVVADLNKDGIQDIAVGLATNANQGLSILLGNGDETFRQKAQYLLPNFADGIVAADVNGDGNLDLVFSLPNDHDIAVALGNGDGTFQQLTQVSIPLTTTVSQIAIGDFNRDGFPDLVYASSNGLCILLGNGNGSFQPAGCVDIQPGGFNSVTVGDFNGDGNLDVALASYGDVVAVVLGNGDGTFQAAQTYNTGSTSVSVTTSDLNGDGKLDLVVVNEDGPNSVSVLLGNGDGSFRNPSSFATATFPDAVAISDMNGDGILDLVVTSGGFNATSVSILLGNGDGTFQNHVDYDGSIAGALAIGDFNNDGRPDVCVSPGIPMDILTVMLQDNGTVVNLSPSKLSFPIQLVGTVSNPKVITLTNTGSAAIKVSKATVDANFSQLNNCNTVQPGGSCLIGVFFTPTVTGSLTGYLAIADNGGGSPQILNLTGVATIVSISPTKLDFGSWPVGHISTPMNVIVANEGNGSMNINQIGIVGVNKQDFSEVNACPTKLQAGASCTITVIFHPSAAGKRSAILGIEDSGGGSPQKVPLTGTGT